MDKSAPRDPYTALHGSCAVCGAIFEPRFRLGTNAKRFCSPQCKDKFWNERRRPPEKRNPPSVAADAAGGGSKQTEAMNSSAPPKKWQRVLHALADGRSFNRFEATRQLRDWCLHTTVSTLQRKGILVARRNETVPGYEGLPTRVCRYWLEPTECAKAAKLLGDQ